MGKLLRLGRTDESVSLSRSQKREFFAHYHNPVGFPKDDFLRFRDDSRNHWWEWEAIEGDRITALTRFLQQSGFMPNATHDGIFGYGTQAAVRLFQEYVRSQEKQPEGAPPIWPDGMVGNDTEFYIEEWKKHDKRARWGEMNKETEDFNKWHKWLQAAAEHYRAHPSTLMQSLIDAPKRGDSLVPEDWKFPKDEALLVGIRRNAHLAPLPGRKRLPDDLFVLLINGMTFYFSGSTDSNPAKKSNGRKKGEGFLLEGQHLYRFNWHNISADRRPHIYKAMKPAGKGVMVARDVHDHDALTEENRADGFDPRPNNSFNIHWNGLGISNWSAGCQVISGSSYIDDQGKLISCRVYTARNDRERGKKLRSDSPRLTMGAYTVLSDLLVSYTSQLTKERRPIIRYSLFREEDLDLIDGLDKDGLSLKLSQLRSESE